MNTLALLQPNDEKARLATTSTASRVALQAGMAARSATAPVPAGMYPGTLDDVLAIARGATT